MSGHLWGAVFAVCGLALAFGGWKTIKSQDLPEGAAGFEGVGLNRRGILILAGYGMLMLGLVLAVIISSFFFIGA